MWGQPATAAMPPAADGLRYEATRSVARYVLLLLGLALPLPAAAQIAGPSGEQSPGARMPSFLGADTLRALESSGSTRRQPAAKPAAPKPPADATTDGHRQTNVGSKPEDEPMAAAEKAAKLRSDEHLRLLSKPSSGGTGGSRSATEAIVSTAPAKEEPAKDEPVNEGPGKDKPRKDGPGKDAATARAALVAPMPGAPGQAAPPARAADGAAATATDTGRPSPAQAAPPAAATRLGDCPPPRIAADAVPAGRARISIVAPCAASAPMRLVYGPYTFERPLDDKGEAVFLVDLFQGASEPISIGVAGGDAIPVTLPATDLDRVSKVAVAWTAAVNLDLHAYAYAADDQDSGHVWAGAPLSAEAALAAAEMGAGRGFLSSADDGRAAGTKVEVYTFVHGADDAPGTITMALDYATRGTTPSGDTCGDGKLASVPFDVVVVERGRITTRDSGLIAAAPCGSALAASARYARAAVPELRIRR